MREQWSRVQSADSRFVGVVGTTWPDVALAETAIVERLRLLSVVASAAAAVVPTEATFCVSFHFLRNFRPASMPLPLLLRRSLPCKCSD